MKPYTIVYWAGEPQFAVANRDSSWAEASAVHERLSECVALLSSEFGQKYDDPDGWDMSDLREKCRERGLRVTDLAPVGHDECWRFDSP